MDPSDLCRKDLNPADIPNVLHFCQRYSLGPYFFGKYRLPDSFLTCESPLMTEPPADIALKYTAGYFPDGSVKEYKNKPDLVKRHAFMACQMISAANNAATYFKQHHCGDKGNFNKTLMYNKKL